MCAGGVPIRNRTNAIDAVLAALDMRDFVLREQARLRENGEDFWEIRIGIHSGPVVAGVVGNQNGLRHLGRYCEHSTTIRSCLYSRFRECFGIPTSSLNLISF